MVLQTGEAGARSPGRAGGLAAERPPDEVQALPLRGPWLRAASPGPKPGAKRTASVPGELRVHPQEGRHLSSRTDQQRLIDGGASVPGTFLALHSPPTSFF